jgi:peptide-N4-(N-acetyl-beta-glucosaminyl)asparagine amidase
VLKYEDPSAQEEARRCVPVEKLQKIAEEKFQKVRASDATVKDDLKRDLFFLELLSWFKDEFFKWVDQPLCDDGVTKAVFQGTVSPTDEERMDGADTVEGYICPNTNKPIRFPRYHGKPAKLLSTRQGRCGEWANCFALICRAFGYDTRHVLDWTDHVWVEVWSEDQKRWLHADPCENICDKPLVYEVGWGKKLTYVIATSKDEVQDVTWRYSKDHKALRARRNTVRGFWLTNVVLTLTKVCQEKYPVVEKKRFTLRR